MTTETNFTVKIAEIDLMGIVHNSNYPVWFEKGRNDYLKKAGISSSQIAGAGFYLPLSRMECKFISPAKFGDEIVVKTKIHSMSCVKITFEYEIFETKKGKLLSTGRTVHAWTNRKIEPINMEKTAPEIFLRLNHFTKSLK